MLSFAPPKRSRIVSVLVFLPLLAVAAFFTWASIRAALVGTRLAEHLERRSAEGPVALTGAISRMSDAQRSPLDQDAAGWVGAVGSWASGRGGTSEFSVRCGLGSFEDVALRTSTAMALRVALVRPDEQVRLGAEAIGWGNDMRIGLDLGPLAGEGAAAAVREARGGAIPEVVKKTCAKEIAALGEAAVYRERALVSGSEVTVLACKQGNDLVACGDGLDRVTVNSLEKMKSRAERDMGAILLLGGVFSLLVLSGAGYTALSFATRTRRTFS